jgi:hypothetical protein
VAGGPEEYALQLALREKAPGATPKRPIAKRLARRRRHAQTMFKAERGRHHGAGAVCRVLRGGPQNRGHRFCGRSAYLGVERRFNLALTPSTRLVSISA